MKSADYIFTNPAHTQYKLNTDFLNVCRAQQSYSATQRYAACPSVCPSVCLSHAGVDKTTNRGIIGFLPSSNTGL